ncbi:CRISPR-associated protein Csx3 [Chloroflexus sp.]|uniref:CRISPR-associated protein Csx3 n=1 Tax=Chloroflexus sp. TaxID=1904827 RepID=UPI004049C240
MNTFPAVLIGGPPHSGKSVLTYILTHYLREQGIEHYVLRACPDGEGDWSQESTPDQVRLLRQKGEFDRRFVDRVCRDIEQRHLPLLVDMGGRPTPDQERIIQHCTHAIVLSATPEGLQEWRYRVERYGLIVIAELASVLDGHDQLIVETPVLHGVISGLERHTTDYRRVVATALGNRLKRLLHYDRVDLKQHHLNRAPAELVVDLDSMIRQLRPVTTDLKWFPSDLPLVLDRIPPQVTIAIYGRGPNWLYATLAGHAAPEPIFLFDPRLGWVESQPLRRIPHPHTDLIRWQTDIEPLYTLLAVYLLQAYLDYDDLSHLTVPQLDPQRGVVVSGKLPYWLLTSLIVTYHEYPWLAVMQPQLRKGVVVWSQVEYYRPGDTIAVSVGYDK